MVGQQYPVDPEPVALIYIIPPFLNWLWSTGSLNANSLVNAAKYRVVQGWWAVIRNVWQFMYGFIRRSSIGVQRSLLSDVCCTGTDPVRGHA